MSILAWFQTWMKTKQRQRPRIQVFTVVTVVPISNTVFVVTNANAWQVPTGRVWLQYRSVDTMRRLTIVSEN